MQKFLNGLDQTKPDWFINFATETEMKDYVRTVTDGRSGTVQAKTTLRHAVAERLFEVVRAAYVGGLVTLVE